MKNRETIQEIESLAGIQVLKVLIVDDEEMNVNMLYKIIVKLGHLVETVGSCKDALQKMAEDNFDLVLLDVNLLTEME